VSAVPRGAVTDDDMIRCRVLRHAWDVFETAGFRNPTPGTRLSLRCTRCATERHDEYANTGEVIRRRYVYVEGYQYAKGDRPTAVLFRVLLMKAERRRRGTTTTNDRSK
jgi:hypothetical protein